MEKQQVHVKIEPQKGFKSIRIDEMIRYKDLLYFLVKRDVLVIYKQSILGFLWAIIRPFFSMIVFTVVFGNMAKVPSDGIPYAVFSYCALLPWTYFSATLTGATSSLISNTSIFTKVYYPRIFIPLTPAFAKLVDFIIAFMFLAAIMVYYQVVPSINMLYLPVLIIIMFLSATGLGMWLSSLALQYRDVKFAMSFMVQLMMYAAPVVFPASLVMEKFGSTAYYLYGLYPIVGVIEGFRSAITGSIEMPWMLISISAFSATVLFITGLFFYRRMERIFADVA